MTLKQLDKKKTRAIKLYSSIKSEVGSSTLDLVNEYVELEIEIEQESNK